LYTGRVHRRLVGRSRVVVMTALLLATASAAWWTRSGLAPSPSIRPALPPLPARPGVPLRRPAVRAPLFYDSYASAFDRGIAAYNADDVDAAADAFEEAVRLAPDDAEARINLGLVYMRLQRPEDGLRELSTAAELERAQRGRDPEGDEGGAHRTIDPHGSRPGAPPR
jgi:tetratricopeptide (TPR) repeat protein